VHSMADQPWKPPSNLDAPPPRRGHVQRWVRTAIRNEDDVRNLAAQFRIGWVPRRADTVPESFPVATIKHGEFAGVIGIHGLILCEMPEELNQRRKDYYDAQTEQQTQAVASDLERVSHPQMPLTREQKSTVTTGRQRRPAVQEDDGEVPSGSLDGTDLTS
jgi:hypothetical protein